VSHLDYAAGVFGLDPDQLPGPPVPAVLNLPAPGTSLAVTGPSGAGKSLALQALMRTSGSRGLPGLRAGTLLEQFSPDLDSAQVLRWLARVGLADGRAWRLDVRQLSSGESRRLQLAMALCARVDPLVIDELDAHLDSVTARVIARNLRRVCESARLRLVVSTHRPEILGDLGPARHVRIEDGTAREAPLHVRREIAGEVVFARGRLRDYDRFARWHYLGPGRPGPVSDVFLALHDGYPMGIALFGYPHLFLSARRHALPEFAPARIRRDGAGGLNARVRLLQRVVIEPRFRGAGIAGRLVAHGLRSAGVPIVECVAQMGAFSDFLLNAGFARVCTLPPPPAVNALTSFLQRHGLNARDLLRDAREGLDPRVVNELDRLVERVARSRVQTGFGSRRSGGGLPPAALRKCLARLDARPAYFLWRGDECQ
jgi:ABC-type lipoprotein export system ATPase subunit/GNAT superfamily N-acetyltransferase